MPAHTIDKGAADCLSGLAKRIYDAWLADARNGFSSPLSEAQREIVKSLPWAVAQAVVDEMTAAAAPLLTAEAWTAVSSLSNNWANYGGAGIAPLRYRKDPLGRVCIDGLLNPANASCTSGSLIFTLPVGYRPASYNRYCVPVVPGSPDTAYIRIGTDGAVSIAYVTKPVWFGFDVQFWPD